ncbi:MAG: class I SAM-dependent methyltransferase [Pseudonocardiaceae bacterium]
MNCNGLGYVFDNDSVHAQDQHQCLAEMLDPLTTARLAQTGVAEGWHCLDVGAGGGSVASWLANRVAPSGRVLATDIKPNHIPAQAGLEVIQHDVVRDPLPEAAFDLVCARMVLRNLPKRHAVLKRLVRALRPGGWLQLDEFDTTYGPPLLMPDARARQLYETFLAARDKLFDAGGAPGAWGQHVAQAMHDAGLVDIDPQPHLELWHAGSAGARLLINITLHLRDQLIDTGMTEAQLVEVRELLNTPTFKATSCAIYSVHGRRPR